MLGGEMIRAVKKWCEQSISSMQRPNPIEGNVANLAASEWVKGYVCALRQVLKVIKEGKADEEAKLGAHFARKVWDYISDILEDPGVGIPKDMRERGLALVEEIMAADSTGALADPCSECFYSRKNFMPKPLGYCYMFETAPDKLPCTQFKRTHG